MKPKLLTLYPRTNQAGRPVSFISSQACQVCGETDLGRRFSVEADFASAVNPAEIVQDFATWTVCHYCLTKHPPTK